MAFETLAGRLPFEGPAPVVIVAHATKPAPPLASLASHLSPQLCAVIDRCLRKDPADRYEGGDALAAALAEAVGPRVAMAPTSVARGGEDRVLSEREAERVWQRAAELQAGIGSASAPRAPTAAMSVVPRTMSNGFKLEHVRQAAHEAGISAPYVTLALDELIRARANLAPRASGAAPLSVNAPRNQARDDISTRLAAARAVTQVRSLGPKASRVAGAPMSLLFEVEVPGQLSPNDFDVITQTIRTAMGEPGVATALGRTLSWSLGDSQKQRRVHVSVTAAAGKTLIRAEERLGPLAGALFGGIGGGFGGGLSAAVLGGIGGAGHRPDIAALVGGGIALSFYLATRTFFRMGATRRTAQLEDLASKLAVQVTELIAHEQNPRSLR